MHIPFVSMVKFKFLAYFSWIILPTQSCLALYSFCANLLHLLIIRLIVSSLSPPTFTALLRLICSRFDMIGPYGAIIINLIFLAKISRSVSEFLENIVLIKIETIPTWSTRTLDIGFIFIILLDWFSTKNRGYCLPYPSNHRQGKFPLRFSFRLLSC